MPRAETIPSHESIVRSCAVWRGRFRDSPGRFAPIPLHGAACCVRTNGSRRGDLHRARTRWAPRSRRCSTRLRSGDPGSSATRASGRVVPDRTGNCAPSRGDVARLHRAGWCRRLAARGVLRDGVPAAQAPIRPGAVSRPDGRGRTAPRVRPEERVRATAPGARPPRQRGLHRELSEWTLDDGRDHLSPRSLRCWCASSPACW